MFACEIVFDTSFAYIFKICNLSTCTFRFYVFTWCVIRGVIVFLFCI